MFELVWISTVSGHVPVMCTLIVYLYYICAEWSEFFFTVGHKKLHPCWYNNFAKLCCTMIILAQTCIWEYPITCLFDILCKVLKLRTSLSDLKRRLISWLGIQQSVVNQANDQWRVCLNACFNARRKRFEHSYDVLFHNCQ